MHLHRDDTASKIGMWLFIFTEILLFGGLFIVYAVYRYQNQTAFHLAGEELNVILGAVNTVVLLISSMTIAMAITAMQRGQKKLALTLLYITLLLALAFMVNKYFEWGAKFEHGIFPNSEYLLSLSRGDILFFGLYFTMTGLHGLHILIGGVFIGFVIYYIKKDELHKDNWQLLENAGLYWHLVDLIWIFLFPLFYLIH